MTGQRWFTGLQLTILVNRDCGRYSSNVNFGASSGVSFGADAEDSGLTEVPADPRLDRDDRSLAYRRKNNEPNADGSERHSLVLP